MLLRTATPNYPEVTMKQTSLSKWLKAALIFLALIGAVVYAVIIPTMAESMLGSYPEFSNRFYPWLIFLLATAIPAYAILFFGWRVASNIGHDKSFCEENARHFKWIAGIAAGLSLYFFAGNTALLFLNMSHPGIFLLSLLFVLAGFAVTIAAAALSRLVTKAAALQDESDLTV